VCVINGDCRLSRNPGGNPGVPWREPVLVRVGELKDPKHLT
jgi:hypothetical protein